MHVGMASIFQNPDKHTTDIEVYNNDVRLAELAEPLGFESVWTVEHHFTDYTMCPDPLQFLTYMAGRTQKVKLGTMVVVLPWHDPMRVAEQVAMLDHLSDGRLILGLGRGAGAVWLDPVVVHLHVDRGVHTIDRGSLAENGRPSLASACIAAPSLKDLQVHDGPQCR